MTIPRLLIATLLLLAVRALFADASSDFTTLLDEHWEWRMANSPVMASRLGDRRYNDQWPDDSLVAIEERHVATREFLTRVYAIDRDNLSTEDQLNYELFRRQLQNESFCPAQTEFLNPAEPGAERSIPQHIQGPSAWPA